MNIGISAIKIAPTKHVISLGDDCRVFVIGDLDGDLLALKSALKNVDFNSQSDALFCLGDTIDRGDKSYELFEYLKAINAYMVLGNHEHLMLESLLSNDKAAFKLWTDNGGNWHKAVPQNLLLSMCDELLKKPLSIVLEYKGHKIGLSHTIPQQWNWECSSDIEDKSVIVESLLWDRKVFNSKKIINNHGINFSIHGHNSTQLPFWIGDSYHIDTNYLGGKPTLLELSDVINKFEMQ
ncbi:metallophosphoesterase [Pseudoalteromonas sp. TB64]|uniref:metallophosphoesterase n=1 Tax=Pseudoalteromonas sp. TB64 TaxID=1938600 RepID=UPI00040C4F2D|nr:metallophosphoesterase [Pseudoalteromonas sp. TB64]